MAHNNNIKCSVSNCRYWHNQHCDATSIEVKVDGGGMEAQSQMHTQCHTFEQK